MGKKVNLDAMIPREDFDTEGNDNDMLNKSMLDINDLKKDSALYSLLRKPDFQRETNEWSVERVEGMILSYLEGDLIPAVILWNSGTYVFVIDGAHRLSALIAWVQDDYGDGGTSRKFFNNLIPEEQLKIAAQVKNRINKNVGQYKDYIEAVLSPELADEVILKRARRLATLPIQLQWIQGNATKAENSFFKINQQAAPIDKTELQILRSRRKPSAIAARAIIRQGTGHKYWSSFAENVQQEIESIAREIHLSLFTPELSTPIKSLDLPIAGKNYSNQTLPLVFELVQLVNPFPPPGSANGEDGDKTEPDDDTGETTIAYLKRIQKVARRISGNHASSLGLHPAVYFISEKGRFQPTSLLAVASLLQYFESKNLLREFTDIRSKFESFLVANKIVPKAVTLKWGSGAKGYPRLRELYVEIFDLFRNGGTETEVVQYIKSSTKWNFINFEDPSVSGSVKFTESTKSEIFLENALSGAVKCGICKGYLPGSSISFDHKKRISEGGAGNKENGQMTHPYCNTTYKN